MRSARFTDDYGIFLAKSKIWPLYSTRVLWKRIQFKVDLDTRHTQRGRLRFLDAGVVEKYVGRENMWATYFHA